MKTKEREKKYLKVSPLPTNVRKDYTGLRQGRLTILGFSHRTPRRQIAGEGADTIRYGTTYWVAECDCGRVFEIAGGNLVSARTENCTACAHVAGGATNRARVRARRSVESKGLVKTSPLAYHRWLSLRKAGRLPPEWTDIEQFVADIGCPINENVGLQYPKKGKLNRKNTYWHPARSKAIIVFNLSDGRRLNMRELASELGITRQRVHQKYLKAIAAGVDPLQYIVKKQIKKRGPYKNTIGKYEKFLDGALHRLEFDTAAAAKKFSGSCRAWIRARYPGRKPIFRRIDNIIFCKVEDAT